jgi:hypothetical protein
MYILMLVIPAGLSRESISYRPLDARLRTPDMTDKNENL